MRTFLSLVLVISVAACATVGDEKVGQLKPGTTIAPVSLMGDALAMRQVGTTVFQIETRDIDVAAWGIDRHTETVAGELMAAKGKFTITRADTQNVRRTVKVKEDVWTGSHKIKAGAEPLAAFAAQSKADYVLLIAPASMGDPFMGTNQTISGYGIYQRSVVGIKRSMNFITLRTTLFDGKTGEELARTQCAVSAPRADWLEPSKLAQPGDDIRAGIENLFAEGLRKCLASLKLVG